MSLILYHSPISPPARAVLLTIRSLGLNVEIKNVNLLKGEHRSAEFLKVNPFHQIPVLVERKSSMSSPTLISDLVLSESRAIMSYLVNSRRADSSLYPIDPVRRAVVDQRLYFDATVVFPRNCLATIPLLVKKETSISQDVKDTITGYMKIIDTFVATNSWFAGTDATLADLSILSNVTQIKACGYNLSQHINLMQWFEQCRQLPGFDENQRGANNFEELLKNQIINGF